MQHSPSALEIRDRPERARAPRSAQEAVAARAEPAEFEHDPLSRWLDRQLPSAEQLDRAIEARGRRRSWRRRQIATGQHRVAC